MIGKILGTLFVAFGACVSIALTVGGLLFLAPYFIPLAVAAFIVGCFFGLTDYIQTKTTKKSEIEKAADKFLNK